MYSLPPFFALRRYRPNVESDYPELDAYKNIAVLLQTTKNENNSWSLDIVQNPHRLLNGAIISSQMDDLWFNTKVIEVNIKQHNSSNVHKVSIKYNNTIIKYNDSIIPLFKIGIPCTVLDDIFFHLKESQYVSFRFEMKNGPIQQSIIKPSTTIVLHKNSIPQHMINTFIESLLDKKEICPILLESFTKDTICITSCGHPISKQSAETWFLQKKTCPVCRAPCDSNILYSWI
jgi:hypothetical protein